MIDVVVAVSDPLVRIGIKAVLDGAEDCRVVGSPEGLDELRQLMGELNPAVLILDVAYRRADDSLLADLAAKSPSCGVLVHVEHSSLECALRHLLDLGSRTYLSDEALRRLDECCLTSLRMGAQGCLPQQVDPESLLRAIRSVASGEVVAAPWLTAVARMGSDVSEEGMRRPITPRELEVIALLARGLGNKQIAKRLGIREQTVKNHVTRAMDKLGVTSRLEVGLMASRMNLELTEDPSS